jgi:hypothetical protein
MKGEMEVNRRGIEGSPFIDASLQSKMAFEKDEKGDSLCTSSRLFQVLFEFREVSEWLTRFNTRTMAPRSFL